MRKVDMLDLDAEYGLFGDEVRAAVDGVFESKRFIGGPAIGQLEKELAKRVGTEHAIAVSNGTDAVLCSLMALGIGAGDEVIVPTLTFFATAGCVSRVGAKPVFVDIDPKTFNMDPVAALAAVTDRTRAIIPVHLFGQCADMDAIGEIAGQRKLFVIEDAAQALGAEYRGRRACSLSNIACVSFYPTKNLGGAGEGGMIFTSDDKLAEIARSLRNHGETSRYHHQYVGGNFRLDTLKAEILLVKLRYWDDFTARRRGNAARYDELLADTSVVTPFVAEGRRHVYHQYSILCDRRDDLVAFLKERGVGSGIYYPRPLHLQECFESLGYRAGDLPVAERVCSRVVSLPCHPMLDEEDVRYVAGCIAEFSEITGDGDQPRTAAADLTV